jgi:hypothetical protein
LQGPATDPRDEPIGDLVGRLIEDGREYARAEIGLYRQIARYRAGRARNGLILLSAGAVLALSALTALIVGFVLGLATLIGPVLAGIAVAAILAGAGFLLVRVGVGGLGALSGDEDEKQAISRGETLQ